MNSNIKSAERLADYFVNFLYHKYRGSRHVRRVASWIGFITLALARIKAVKNVRRHHTRQLEFDYKKHKFKVKYDHTIGTAENFRRGGIEISEVLPGRGEPKGESVLKIKTLLEAENAYHSLKKTLDKFCRK